MKCGSPASQANPAIPSHDNAAQANRRPLRAYARRGVVRAVSISRWKQLESTDLAVYAANLRAAGCPPRTVRDILLPLLDEKFAHPESPFSEPTNFWASFSQRQAAAAARDAQERALEQQKDKALKEVLGFTWTSEGLKQAYAGEAAVPFGYLDYERAEKFLCVADRFKKKFSHVDISRRIDRHSDIYEEWRREVGGILSPAEFEEIELREILTTYQRRNPNFYKADLSDSELRQLMVFRRELTNPLPSALLGTDELLQEPDWDGEKKFLAKVRSLLGDNRFIDYLKCCDVSIERTLAALKKEHLPPNLALELFDFRQEVIARAQEIRQLPLRRAEKREQLEALHQNAVEQLSALSKDAANSLLLARNQDWLQEIADP